MRNLATGYLLGRTCAYDGTQLRPHFLRSVLGLKGDAVGAFRGPCEVRGAALVDLEDRAAGDFIRSPDMLHFIVECFDPDLPTMVLLQRVLASLVVERLRAALVKDVTRRGDDVFVGDGKLSVSIATKSPVSGLIHFGINVDGGGAPVKTASLNQLGIDPDQFAEGILSDLAGEVSSIIDAVTKVAPAHGGLGS